MREIRLTRRDLSKCLHKWAMLCYVHCYLFSCYDVVRIKTCFDGVFSVIFFVNYLASRVHMQLQVFIAYRYIVCESAIIGRGNLGLVIC